MPVRDRRIASAMMTVTWIVALGVIYVMLALRHTHWLFPMLVVIVIWVSTGILSGKPRRLSYVATVCVSAICASIVIFLIALRF